MKRILFVFFGAFLMLQSCKDSFEEPVGITQVEIQDIELSLRAISDCGVIPELCPKPWLYEIEEPTSDPGPTGPGGPSIGGSMRIVVVDNGIEHQIEPLNHISGSKQFSVRTAEGVYVISDTDDPHVLKYQSEEIVVPDCISSLLAMDFEAIKNGRVSESDFSTHFEGRPVATESSGRIVVDDFIDSDHDCPPPSYKIPPEFKLQMQLLLVN